MLLNIKSLSLLILTAVVFTSCFKNIKTGEDLSTEDLTFLKEMGLLEEGEKIQAFYSQSGEVNQVTQAGNFYSDKRIAAYWVDLDDASKSTKYYSYYKNIVSMSLEEEQYDLFGGSFILVKTNHNLTFKVYIDGEPEETTQFFEGAMAEWNKNK